MVRNENIAGDREEKWDTYHQDYVLWGNGITEVVTGVVGATEKG